MTWQLPEQLEDFKEHVRTRRLATKKGKRSPTYIIKPSGGSEGNGIVLLRHESRIPYFDFRVHEAGSASGPLSYIAPLLFHKKKFDLRLYVLIRSVDPLEVYRVYLHTEGLARFCTEDTGLRAAR